MIVCDTDVMIDYLDRNSLRHVQVKKCIDSWPDTHWVLSVITCMELILGVANKVHQDKVFKGLSRFNVLHITTPISALAYDLSRKYSLSHGIGLGDSLIAATCLIDDLPLYTYNQKHFKFLPELELYTPNFS